MPKPLPKLQRVAAYALVLRDEKILLTRLASRISADEKWHLPGGGVDHGENPRDALIREIREETGLEAEVGDTARIYSAHLPSMWRKGRRWDYQALRIVYDAWVPVDARSEEHTSELQSRRDLVCRLLLEKKKKKKNRCLSTDASR